MFPHTCAMKESYIILLIVIFISASVAMDIHGVNFFPFTAHSISSPTFLMEFEQLRKMGVDYVGVNFELAQANATSSE